MNKFVIGAVLISILLTGFFVFFFTSRTPAKNTTVASASNTPLDSAAIVEVENNYYDWGNISVKSTQEKDFIVKNVGTSPLKLTNINTSCGCTVAKVIYEGKETPELGMHKQAGFDGEIKPGDSATVKVIYRPFTMPVYGPVQREVYLSTNDPNNQKIVLRVQAVVQK